MEKLEKTLAIKGFLCYNTAVYAKNTQRGFLRGCPSGFSERRIFAEVKKPKTED